MRTRQKVTAVGAVAVASAAVAGGALFTSHAMAAGSAPPGKGTVVIVSRTEGSDQAIKCTYHDVDLPPLNGGQPSTIHGVAGTPAAGVVGVKVDAPGGAVHAEGPVKIEHGTVTTGSGEGVEPPSFDVAGTPPDGAPPPIVLDDKDARPGTDAECAALRPDVEQP